MREYWKDWKFWDPKLNPLPENPATLHHVSIVTTCMDRCEDLKKTLKPNILSNADYENLQFVVLNYNSKDDMDEFMLGPEIKPYIDSGKVLYIKTKSPKHYSMSKSRNLAFRQAKDGIVTSVDADNFTGDGFASYLNKMGNLQPQKCCFCKGKRLIHGRIGFFKSEFENELGGYDEKIENYGAEDHDLMARAMCLGYTMMWWAGNSPSDFTKRIKTPRSLITKNFQEKSWKTSEYVNKQYVMEKLKKKDFVANVGVKWGYEPDLEIIR